jgi:DNA invertase Pin-like site-specific DNA recombinase
MAKIGYVRVSSSTQSTDRQDDVMAELGVERVFLEKVSGKNANRRPELKKMLDYVREGDTVVVADISRLARSTRDLLSIVDHLTHKGVDFVSLKEKIDTTTPQGRFVLTIFGALAELERENILSRQREGIDAAKARGKKLGRPAMEFPEGWEAAYASWKNGELSPTEAAKELKLKRPTFYLMARRWEDSCATSVAGN